MAYALPNSPVPDAFRDVLLRLPSRRPQKGRQALRDVTGVESWAGNDDDYERALAWTPGAFTWVRDRSHLVELPAIWCRVPVGEHDVVELSEEVLTVLAGEGVPAPHMLFEGSGSIVVLWAIEPFRRPKPNAPENNLFAWKRGLEDWRKCVLKLSFALEPLGAVPLDPATAEELAHSFVPYPLSADSPLRPVVALDEDPPRLLATPAPMTQLHVVDISRPLGRRHDARMFAALGISRPRSKKHWLRSAISLAALETQAIGERHTAAVKIACAAVWDGYDYDATLRELRNWEAHCEKDGRFPFKRGKGDELELLAAWAIRRLKPGGPDRAALKKNPNRTTRDGVAASVVGFLRSVGGSFTGSKEELGKQSALWALAAGQPALAPRSTLRRALADLKASGQVLHSVARQGATWSSTWSLPTGPTTPTTSSPTGNSKIANLSNPRVQKGKSTWAPGLQVSALTHRGGFAVGRLPPAGGGPGEGKPTSGEDVGAAVGPDAETEIERPATSSPENDRAENVAGVPPSASFSAVEAGDAEGDASSRRPRQRRLRLVDPKKRRRRRRRDDELPPLTDEVVAALADVAPSLDAATKRDLLERARRALRPRQSVLENFEGALRKAALRLRRRDVLSAAKPLSPQAERDLRTREELAASVAAAKATAPDAIRERTETLADFRRLLSTSSTPLHLRAVEDRARRLHDEGVVVVPLKPRTKEAAVTWTEWQQQQMPMTLLRRHLATLGADAGLAILCGPVSGLCVADLDHETAVAWAKKHLPETPWRTKTARGEHWFYRHPSTPLPTTAPPWAGQLQGEGRYVVGPGSFHPDGHRYEALGDWGRPKEDLPVFDERWLIDVEALRETRAKILKGDS